MNEFDPADEQPRRRRPLSKLVLLLPALLLAFWAGSLVAPYLARSSSAVDSADSRSADGAPGGQGTVERNEPSVRSAAAAGDLRSSERETIDLFRAAAPSVVFITTNQSVVYRGRLFDVPQGSGSGFVWDRQGHIVTNFHVVQDLIRETLQARSRGRNPSRSARVQFADGTSYDATVVGWAPEKDLAVLEIEAPRRQLSPLAIGTSGDLQVGQSVFAIGNPFGLDHTLTTGVVSALGREIQALDRTPIRDVIQTDAAINPGNSGGPLLDSSGRLIGVNTQIYSPSGASAGIGFAIPVDTVSWVVPDLIEYGQVIRPVLGIESSSRITDQLRIDGIHIDAFSESSGAERAGLISYRESNGRQLGDIIVAVDGKPVKNTQELRLALEDYNVGDTVEVTVIRDPLGSRKKIDVPVRLGQMRR